MAKPLILQLALLAATLAVTVAAPAPGCRAPAPAPAPAAMVVGGWSPIRVLDDPNVQKLGWWAVARHARLAKVKLEFCRVTRGEAQMVAGTNYVLIVEAVDGAGRTAPFLAAVYEDLFANRTLTAFKPAARCPPRTELCA